MNIKAIACDVFRRELYTAAAKSANTIDIEFLPTGKHDLGSCLARTEIQKAINRVDGSYDAIVLGYGLCNYSLAGVAARGYPLIIPRARDCITLFLGSRRRYEHEIEERPGTFFKSAGWIDSNAGTDDDTQVAVQRGPDLLPAIEDMTQLYGPDNGRFLYDELRTHAGHCNKLTYVEMGVEPGDRWKAASRTDAEQHGWQFGVVEGDMRLFQQLLDGPWDTADFLTVPIGSQIAVSYDNGILTTATAGEHPS